MTRVFVAVEVTLQRRVHGYHAETADKLGAVGQLAGAEGEVFPEEFHVLVNVLNLLVRAGHGRTRGLRDAPLLDKVDNCVLNHLGKHL